MQKIKTVFFFKVNVKKLKNEKKLNEQVKLLVERTFRDKQIDLKNIKYAFDYCGNDFIESKITLRISYEEIIEKNKKNGKKS